VVDQIKAAARSVYSQAREADSKELEQISEALTTLLGLVEFLRAIGTTKPQPERAWCNG